MIARFEKAIFYALIFSIPFQTRVVLRSWGIGFSEWNAAFLYWTDLLILALLGLWFLRFLTNKKAPIGTTNIAIPIGAACSTEFPANHPVYSLANDKTLSSPNINSKALEGRGFAPLDSRVISQGRYFTPPKANLLYQKFDWFLIGFIAISAVSIVNASNQAIAFYQLIKLVEFSLLYFYVKSNLVVIFNLTTAFFVFLASGIFQAILSILQYVKQSDLGLRFLGETVLNPELFNVAIFMAEGEKIMRPYGTTPHPNVLALFLFMAVFIYYFYCFVCRGNPRQLQNDNPAPFGDKLLDSKNTKAVRRDILQTRQEKIGFNPEWCWGTSIWGLTLYSVLLFGFLFSFSRVIVFLWLMIFFFSAGHKIIRSYKSVETAFSNHIGGPKIILTTILIIFLFSVLFWPQVLARLQVSFQEEAVSLRGFYNKVSLFEKPFFGVGLGNFVNWFKEINPGLGQNLYQPVHNIYLLIFSETGILGLAAFLLFLIFMAKSYLSIKFSRPFHFSFFIIFVSLLFFGLFDHFLLTIQQGRIVFWLVSGLIAAIGPHSSVDRAQASGA